MVDVEDPILKEEPLEDMVNSPKHYVGDNGKVELIDIIATQTFTRGSAIKYLFRAGNKDPQKELEDLDKASKYIEFERRVLTGEPISDTLRKFIQEEMRKAA